MHTSVIVSISLIIYYLIRKLNKNYNLGKEKDFSNDRKVHIKNNVSRLGGITLLSIFFLVFSVNDSTVNQILLFGLFIFILGILEDLKSDIPTYIRINYLIFVISSFVILNNFVIYNFNLYYLDLFLNSYPILLYLFSILGLLFLINGFNFIDGLNGLVLGYSLVVLFFFCYYSYSHSTSIYTFSISLFFAVLVLFYFNFIFGKILAGDGGSYFLGFLIGAISIHIANEGLMSSTSIAILIFYPFMEAIFTPIKRHFILKTSFYKSDSFHLHQILYRIILKYNIAVQLNIKAKYTNSISSLFIILTIFTLISLGFYLSQFINH